MASSSTARFRPSLPTELWFRIFRLATGDPVSAEYLPFAGTQHRDPAPLSVKSAITVVCKTWRAVGLPFLYEDVIIGKSGVDALVEGLERIEPFRREKNGCFVRRVTLSCTRIDDDVAVLKCCPHVEIVVKPFPKHNRNASRIQKTPFPDPTLSFPSLVRIEWTIAQNESYPFAEESLSLLWHILQITPGVRYLSLAGSEPRQHRRRRVHLADFCQRLLQLQVLSVRDITLADKGGSVLPLPNLTHLITDGEAFTRNPEMISVVELTKAEGFRTYYDQLLLENAIVRILQSYPRMRQLSYAFSGFRPPVIPDTHWHLECVRLLVEGHPYWVKILGQHLSAFCSPVFPSLRRVALHRYVESTQEKEIIETWSPKFTDRNCVLEWVS